MGLTAHWFIPTVCFTKQVFDGNHIDLYLISGHNCITSMRSTNLKEISIIC